MNGFRERSTGFVSLADRSTVRNNMTDARPRPVKRRGTGLSGDPQGENGADGTKRAGNRPSVKVKTGTGLRAVKGQLTNVHVRCAV